MACSCCRVCPLSPADLLLRLNSQNSIGGNRIMEVTSSSDPITKASNRENKSPTDTPRKPDNHLPMVLEMCCVSGALLNLKGSELRKTKVITATQIQLSICLIPESYSYRIRVLACLAIDPLGRDNNTSWNMAAPDAKAGI